MDDARVDDLVVIAHQIGRSPRGVDGVARRCRFGCPQAVAVHPVVDGSPFPTLYWLTCPYLREAVSALESDGWVSRLEDALCRNDRLRTAFERAQQAYREQRAARLSAGDRQRLLDRGMLEGFLAKGIGGVADFGRVKCLHAHVAHALVGENPIGDLVLAHLGTRECEAKRMICSALV
ncbi:MAG: DUF501 domain-containing protein [Candidatus Bipolaricaulis sp.]|nr:DUF501 domain-containing protein [Candidatus Bipolaricaulis sp.]MDD5219644.1 DUF501 domain-containing protein [Candidatus Bipolaricaulis sp.]MDD5646174.1 DUF501 domain-containing protein [Candidatus Bipolaricaulis sp.]